MDAYAHSYHSMSACIHVTISVSGVSKGYIEGYQRVCLLPPVRRDCHSRSASRPEKSSTSTLYHQTLSWQPAFQRTESTKKRHEQQQTGNVWMRTGEANIKTMHRHTFCHKCREAAGDLPRVDFFVLACSSLLFAVVNDSSLTWLPTAIKSAESCSMFSYDPGLLNAFRLVASRSSDLAPRSIERVASPTNCPRKPVTNLDWW